MDKLASIQVKVDAGPRVLGQNEVAKIFDVSLRTVSRWVVDGVPRAVTLVLKALEEKKITLADVERWSGRAAQAAPAAPAPSSRPTQMDGYGRLQYADYPYELVVTRNPLAD